MAISDDTSGRCVLLERVMASSVMSWSGEVKTAQDSTRVRASLTPLTTQFCTVLSYAERDESAWPHESSIRIGNGAFFAAPLGALWSSGETTGAAEARSSKLCYWVLSRGSGLGP